MARSQVTWVDSKIAEGFIPHTEVWEDIGLGHLMSTTETQRHGHANDTKYQFNSVNSESRNGIIERGWHRLCLVVIKDICRIKG